MTREVAAERLYASVIARPDLVSAPFDASQINAMLDSAARVTWSAAGPDAASGAFRMTGVRFEILGDKPATLFTADEVLLWNADPAALAARFKGERLGDEIRLFDRIELTGVKMDTTDYLNMVDDAVTETMPEAGTADIIYQDSSMEVGHLVLSGMTLHPWTFKEADGEDEGLAAVRLLSALARSFSLEAAYLGDTVSSQTISDVDGEGYIRSTTGGQLLKGYDRGNLYSAIQTGVTFSGALPMPAAEAGVLETGQAKMLEMSGRSGFAAWTGLNFAPLLAFAERGEIPPITARDLLSLGTYTVTDTEMSMGGAPVIEIGLIDVSADKFAWFLPERIRIHHEDAAFNLAELFNVAAQFGPADASGDEDFPIGEFTAMLERAGIGKLSGDGNLEVTWNSETGVTRLEGNSVSDGLYTDETLIEMRLPTYTQIVPAFGIDGKTPDAAALSELFAETSAFVGGHYSLTDTGGFDAAASLVIEIAKISGDDDGMLESFADATPEAVRLFASGILMISGSGAMSELPPAAGWIKGLSQFVSKGGTFTVKLAPAKAVTAADLADLEPDAGMADSPGLAELVSLLGLTMVHTPPAETADGAP